MGLWVTKNYDLLYETIYIGCLHRYLLYYHFRRTRYSWMFFVCAVLFFAMSLGPDIRLYPGADSFASRFFYTVARYIPFIEAMEVPWEYSFMGIFCLAISAGYGIEFAFKNLPTTKWKSIVRVEILIVFWNSFGSLLYCTNSEYKSCCSWIYTQITEQDGGAVFDFPPRRPYAALFPGDSFFDKAFINVPFLML